MSNLLRLALEKATNNHYSVYVVELSKDVLNENKFVKRNPDYVKGKPCVYVGYTGLIPEERFKKHKAGIKSNVYVERYGTHLLPGLYKDYINLPHDDALRIEEELAIRLQKLGYGVWQA
ncbi:MAG: hypothetical protein ACD_84C00001G0003 [uncultured bacterium]|nr:MAG: hypothetical protein ACD_84C00001G0003 [uncultured bacterium]